MASEYGMADLRRGEESMDGFPPRWEYAAELIDQPLMMTDRMGRHENDDE